MLYKQREVWVYCSVLPGAHLSLKPDFSFFNCFMNICIGHCMHAEEREACVQWTRMTSKVRLLVETVECYVALHWRNSHQRIHNRRLLHLCFPHAHSSHRCRWLCRTETEPCRSSSAITNIWWCTCVMTVASLLKNPRFRFFALNTEMRWRALQTGRVYVKQHPGDAQLSPDVLRNMVGQEGEAFSNRVLSLAFDKNYYLNN